MSYYITLVHGTFASDAEWIEENSFLAERLKSLLGKDTKLDKLNWSGHNSHKARLEDSVKLADKLKANLHAYPSYKHVVIAHSHGGNVFLYALDQFDTVPDNLAFVSLATPFLNCSERKLPYSLSLIKKYVNIVLGFMLFIATIGVGCGLYCIFFENGLWDNIRMTFFNSLLLGGLLLVQYAVKKMETIYRRQEKEVKELYRIFTRSYPIKMASFFIAGDEALIWLSSGRKVPEVVFNIRRVFEKLTAFIAKQKIILIAALTVLAFTLVILEDVTDFQGEQVFMGIGMAIGFFLFMLIIVLIYTVLIGVIASYFFKSNPLIFGWESIGFQLHLNILPGRTPAFIPSCKTYNCLPTAFERRKHLLRHSYLYQDEKTVNDIADWIKEL